MPEIPDMGNQKAIKTTAIFYKVERVNWRNIILAASSNLNSPLNEIKWF